MKATYNGETYDPRTGDIYLRARYYNTHTGTFTTEDTYIGRLMDPRSLNRYAYAHGNPVNYQDPSGHDAARQEMVNKNREASGLTVYYGPSSQDMTSKAARSRGLSPLSGDMEKARSNSAVSSCVDPVVVLIQIGKTAVAAIITFCLQ